jgi:glycosyltransferase involved in cell wall biosynthesis
LRIALIVPVSSRERDRDRLRWIHRHNLAQARALARLGAEVHLFVDAPFAAVEHDDGIRLHFVRRRVPAIPGAHLVAAALLLRPQVLHQFHLLDVRTLALSSLAPVRTFAEYNTGPVPHTSARRAVMRAATRRLTGVFFTAVEMAAPFVSLGAISPAAPIVAVPEISSLVPAADREGSRRALGVRGLLVLVVARAAEVKDPFTALEAFDRIKMRRPDATLIWAAIEEGPLHREVRMRVEKSGGRMLLRAEIAPLYAAADVMLHTSRREACGAAFVEALGAGVPIAGSDIPPFRALALGGAARLCPLGDPGAFAEAALELAADPEARRRARARFENALTFDAIAERKMRAYRDEPVEPCY